MKKLLALVALLWAAPAFATDPQFGAIRVEAFPDIRHAFVSTKSQGSDASKVSVSEWNAAHVAPGTLVASVPTGFVWPAQPAAVTEFCGASTSYRWRANLTSQTTIRLTAQVVSAGAATSALRLQYTTDLTGSTGWDYLDSVSGPSVSINATGVTTSATVSIATAAKADVLLRLVGINGDGGGGTACYSTIPAATAAALAANGTNCASGQFPLGVDAGGNSESCTALPTTISGTANQITASAATGAITLSIPTNPTLPGTTTGTFSGPLSGNASTATALAANGSNCSAGSYPLGVDASGAAESCTVAFSAEVASGPTYCADAGASDAYACNLSPAPASYAAIIGVPLTFKANTVNTGAATISFNSLGAQAIVKVGATTTTALVTNDIRAGALVTVQWDGANFECLSCNGNYANLAIANTWALSQTFTSAANFNHDTTVAANHFLFVGGGVGGLAVYTIQTPDTVQLLTGAAANSLQVMENADAAAFDFQNACTNGLRTSACTDPTFTVRSHNQDTGEFFSAAHDGKAAVIVGGNSTVLDGTIRLGGTVTLTESSATAVLTVPVAVSTATGGEIIYTVEARDATNTQSRTGKILYSVANTSGGTETCNAFGILTTQAAGGNTTNAANPTEVQDGSGVGAITSGTLTYAWSVDTSGTNSCVLKLNAVSSLTQTTLQIHYTVIQSGPGVSTGGD